MKLGRLLRLEEEGVTALAESESIIIVGGKHGTITLLDHNLQKVQWVQSFKVSKILAISLRVEDEYFAKLEHDTALGDFVLTCDDEQCFYYSSQTEEISPIIEGPGIFFNLCK